MGTGARSLTLDSAARIALHALFYSEKIFKHARTLTLMRSENLQSSEAKKAKKANRRLLRAVQLVNDSPISTRRKPHVLDAVRTIAARQDPVPIVRAIIDRANRPEVQNRGGYIAQAILEEAATPQGST